MKIGSFNTETDEFGTPGLETIKYIGVPYEWWKHNIKDENDNISLINTWINLQGNPNPIFDSLEKIPIETCLSLNFSIVNLFIIPIVQLLIFLNNIGLDFYMIIEFYFLYFYIRYNHDSMAVDSFNYKMWYTVFVTSFWKFVNLFWKNKKSLRCTNIY